MGAELLVQCLEEQGVQYIFGIPGAKVDTIFDVLADHDPRLILCRHEQNAAFIALQTIPSAQVPCPTGTLKGNHR